MDSYNYVLKNYFFDNRHYHDIHHINKMLLGAHVYGDPALVSDGFGSLNENLFDAIVFHDVYYDTTPGEKLASNEKMSATIYKQFHTDYKKENDASQVVEMILATEHHFDGTEYTSYFENLILDLDLLGFGDDWFSFLNTQKLIDREYEKWYDPKIVKEKRIEFLRDIFTNKTLRYRVIDPDGIMTKQAYRNIKELLEELDRQ